MPQGNRSGIKNKTPDVAYAKKSEAQKLDIYLPEVGDGPFPVIVQIHGGAFRMGDKGDAQVNPSLEGLTHGYAVVSIIIDLAVKRFFRHKYKTLKQPFGFFAQMPKNTN